MVDEMDVQSNIDEDVDSGLGKHKCICGTWITDEQEANHVRWSETHHQFMKPYSKEHSSFMERLNPDSVIVD